jgi:hypothetical protein
MEQDVHGVKLAAPSQVRARGESRRRRTAAVAIGLAALAVLTGAALWTASPWRSQVAGPPTGTCPPQPTVTYAPGEARVFLRVDASPLQRDAVEGVLRGLGLTPTFVSRQESWELFQKLYCGSPDLIAKTRPESLPEYFVITLTGSIDGAAVRSALAGVAAVDTIVVGPGPSRTDATRTSGSCLTASPGVTGGREVHVFLTLGATGAQRDAVEARLRGLGLSATIAFSDHQDAYQRFAAAFCDAPDLLAATKPEALPESFVVTLADAADYPTVRDAVTGMPGVDTVIRAP